MTLVSTPAIVLATLRYSESSKIVRLATRDHGVQSAIAKGALRAKSRFGGSLQLLSEGQAQLLMKEHRELNILTAFDLRRFHVGLAGDLERYALASALSEVMLRFAPSDPHPESFDVLQSALVELEAAPAASLEPLGFRLLWRLVSVLGFAPSVDTCVIDGTPVAADGPLPFSTRDGGALCVTCARQRGATQLAQRDRRDLVSLLDPSAALPTLDSRHGAAHRRLLARYIRYHLAEGAELPALDFWTQRPWAAA
ncbi:MAG TPA: DNA repair protein RecO [Gemmatimonadales bacterium]|jgi:DNA repair protein RecO (recombination protein O)|nr:DNA repair protein RecO [Gemmatimonadales bacterium]